MSKNMFSEINKIVVLGAGGDAAYYIAKVLNAIGKNVVCYDINSSDKTKELERLGCVFNYKNPETCKFEDADLIVYTTALPNKLISIVEKENRKKEVIATGDYYQKIVNAYEKGEFKGEMKIIKAIKDSEIAPLFDIDFSGVTFIGVTGSKGKTTTAYMIYETLLHLGVKVSSCTTIGARVLGKEIETGLHTSTPSAQELAYLFKEMLKGGSEVIVLEASSHAIATGRVAGLTFDIGVITNIQPEHLDFHKNIEGVINTKEKVVTKMLKPSGTAILNLDDKHIVEAILPKLLGTKKKIFGVTQNKKIKDIKNVTKLTAGSVAELQSCVNFKLSSSIIENETLEYSVPYPGKFNVSNIIPAVIISKLLKHAEKDIVESLSKIGTVSGRNEVLQETPFKVVLDFAHTPESLEAILATYRKQCKNGKLIVVFGAAGKRDTRKRPKMGAMAGKFADISILTAEDPRTEDIKDINDTIAEGWSGYVEKHNLIDKRELRRFEDLSNGTKCRIDAIKDALNAASPGDVVIFAGKGPEKSLCIGLEELPWNEKEVIKKLLPKN